MVGVIEAGFGTQQTVALFVLFDEGGFVIGAEHGKALITLLENGLELAVVAAVHAPSKDMTNLTCPTESDTNLASSSKQGAQRSTAFEQDVLRELDLSYRPLVAELAGSTLALGKAGSETEDPIVGPLT